MKRWDAIVPLVVVALIAGAVYYFRTAEESVAPPVLAGAPSSTGERVAACTELAGEVGARLEACIEQVPRARAGCRGRRREWEWE